jgi:heat shock protein 5
VIPPVNQPVLGIDLGTSFSRVAVFVDGKAEIVVDEDGDWQQPSILSIEEGNTGRVGTENVFRLFGVKRVLGGCLDDRTSGEREKRFGGLGEAKRIGIGIDGEIEVEISEENGSISVGDFEMNLRSKGIEILARVFGELKKLGEKRLGERVENAVISVPVSFNESQRNAITDAAGLSGLKVLHLLSESTAAALWAFGERYDDILCVVFHLGSGTFDVSVVWLRWRQYEVIGSDGNCGIGGQDIDDRAVDYLLSVFKNRTGKDASIDIEAVSRLRIASEEAKRRLCEMNETDIEISEFFDGESLRERLTRNCFEDLISDLLSDMVDTTRRVVSSCVRDPRDLEHIVFCGGSTRIPKLRRLICDIFDAELTPSFDVSDESIALMAATEGASLMSDPSAARFVHTSKYSVTLQMAYPREEYDETIELLRRVGRLPASGSRVFEWETLGENIQRFGLFEGECQFAGNNRLVGEVDVKGLVEDADGFTRVNASVVLNENNQVNFTIEQEQTGVRNSGIFKVFSQWRHCEDADSYCQHGMRFRSDGCEECSRRELNKFGG